MFLSSTILLLLPLYFMLSCFSWIATHNETVYPSDVLGDYLSLCGTIIYIIKLSPRITLTKALFLVIIEALIVCRNGNENMVLQATPYMRARETVTNFLFTTKVVL